MIRDTMKSETNDKMSRYIFNKEINGCHLHKVNKITSFSPTICHNKTHPPALDAIFVGEVSRSDRLNQEPQQRRAVYTDWTIHVRAGVSTQNPPKKCHQNGQILIKTRYDGK